MKHQTHTMIKNAMIILAASSALSIASCSFADSQGVTYADDTPSQQTYQCTVSTDPEKVVELNEKNNQTPGGCAALSIANYQTYLHSHNDWNKLQFDDNDDMYHYVQTFSKTIHLSPGDLSYTGLEKYGYEWVKDKSGLHNEDETLATFCAPIECNYVTLKHT